MRKNLTGWSLLVAVGLWCAGSMAVAGENWIGTWKLNAAKSKATNAISAQTLKFEVPVPKESAAKIVYRVRIRI